MIRYYKKQSPKVPVQLGNGAVIRFEAADNVVGIYSTDQEWIQGQIKQLQDRGVGGVFDCTAEEYEALKKKASSPRSYRDEFGKAMLRRPAIEQHLASPAEGEESKPVVPVGGGQKPVQPAPIIEPATENTRPTKPKAVRRQGNG